MMVSIIGIFCSGPFSGAMLVFDIRDPATDFHEIASKRLYLDVAGI